MPIDFDDANQYAVGATSKKLESDNGIAFRWSEIVPAALRAAGILDNMVDSTTAPTDTTVLWMDESTRPAPLKRYDAPTTSWVPVTYDWFTTQAVVGALGTAAFENIGDKVLGPSDPASISANWVFEDNISIALGSDSDVAIKYNGTDAEVRFNGVTALRVIDSMNQQILRVFEDGDVFLNHKDQLRFRTTSTGAQVAGNLEADTMSGAVLDTSVTTAVDKVPTSGAVNTALAGKSNLPASSGVISPAAGAPFSLPLGGQYFIYAVQINTTNGANSFVQVSGQFPGGDILSAPSAPFAWTGFFWKVVD